jgi:hypothetical protein
LQVLLAQALRQPKRHSGPSRFPDESTGGPHDPGDRNQEVAPVKRPRGRTRPGPPRNISQKVPARCRKTTDLTVEGLLWGSQVLGRPCQTGSWPGREHTGFSYSPMCPKASPPSRPPIPWIARSRPSWGGVDGGEFPQVTQRPSQSPRKSRDGIRGKTDFTPIAPSG